MSNFWDWRYWRYILILIFAATAFFNLLSSSMINMTLQYQVLSGITIQSLLGIASAIGIIALWKAF